MYYFVIAADGSRYGPADVDTLVQWTREGRIIAETMLIERGSERSLRADSITAIAAVLQRITGDAPAVRVERGLLDSREAATMTQTPRHPPPPPPPPLPTPGLQPLHAERAIVSPKSKIAAGLLGIFLGGLGIHRFYLGYTGIGLLMLLVSVFGGKFTHGASCGLVHVWGAIEGIIILCGGFSDADGRPLRD
jgi:hypothetical protein